MPSGLKVLERARKIRPSIKVIMVSAYGSEFLKSEAEKMGAYAFLDKPFDIKDFIQIVRSALTR